MKAVLFITAALVAWTQGSEAFFDIFKTAPNAEASHTPDQNLVRGVPEYLHHKYLEDAFMCDGSTKLPKSAVNDNFCDCLDGTDEPGTSACAQSTFHCINKGYKMIMLPSSRVDDGVCDCCDGSDEATIKCPNVCIQAAEREKAAMAGVLNAYKMGSAIRTKLIESVKLLKAEAAAKIGPLSGGVARIEGEIAAAKEVLETKRKQVEAMKQEGLARISSDIDSLLRLGDQTAETLSHLLSNLMSALNIESHHIDALLPEHLRTGAHSAGVSVDEAVPEEDSEGDHADDAGYDGSAAEDAHAQEEAERQVAAATEQITSCSFVEHSSDSRLLPLCRAEDVAEESSRLLRAILHKYDAHRAYMLLTGFARLSDSYAGAADFVRKQLDAAPEGDVCPSDFQPIQEHCSLNDELKQALAEHKEAAADSSEHPSVAAHQEEVATLEGSLRSLESEMRAAEEAAGELETHAGQLEFLALKDQCFDVADGKFTYSLCVLGSVTQRENEGGRNSVTLGKFASLERVPKDSSVVLHYEDGQHCWNHGARKADVKVVCGAEHALISATEPSTCHYSLVFESPAACSPDFARANGIEV